MTDKVKIVWLSHLKTDQERDSFKNQILANYDVWERLKGILQDKDEAKEMTYKDYDSPAWAYKQAHANGYREALFEIYDLLP